LGRSRLSQSRTRRAAVSSSRGGEVAQHRVDHSWPGDERDDTHVRAEARTDQRINLVDSPDELRPALAQGSDDAGLRAVVPDDIAVWLSDVGEDPNQEFLGITGVVACWRPCVGRAGHRSTQR
jgi:hypothetical protein